ncbi:unnamed protein product [Pleuronectes platessa]|uniref:Uncharacterized protein n=1 Tax=Pleuronectes platessa TaxID=8262 RepID=A0A9N7YB30_PLEPL|nr:unnamed protein product [Pleuronectes platessa]
MVDRQPVHELPVITSNMAAALGLETTCSSTCSCSAGAMLLPYLCSNVQHEFLPVEPRIRREPTGQRESGVYPRTGCFQIITYRPRAVITLSQSLDLHSVLADEEAPDER